MTILLNPQTPPIDAAGGNYKPQWLVKVFEANTAAGLQLLIQAFADLLDADPAPFWVGEPTFIGTGAGNNTRVLLTYVKFIPA